jgi:FkbM family methyltransferase
MHPDSGSPKRRLLVRTNDLAARDWPARLLRYARAKLHHWCTTGMRLADDPRVIRAWRRGWDPQHFLELQRWFDDGFRPRVIYDIGANQGLWSEMVQVLFTPETILLFEPQREVREQALARQRRVGGDWQILPVGLGDRDEIHSLHLTRNRAASSLLAPLAAESSVIDQIREVGQEKVSIMPLDTLVAGKGLPVPDLVKIDVQGFEGRVLAGGQKTLGAARRMVVEVSLQPLYDGQSLMPDVMHTLAQWGFELDDLQETFRQWPGPLRQVDLWLKRTS